MALLEQVRGTQAAGKIVYTAKVHTIGGRENGEARSSDGQLDVKLSVPGTSRPGTNPEQLFAAGWSACFEGAIAIVAQRRKIKLSGLAIDAEVNLHAANGEYALSARFNVSLPGLDREVAESLVAAAEQVCPYSKVTRGNIDVVFNVV
jgi:osmotically inducible protein OsmC